MKQAGVPFPSPNANYALDSPGGRVSFGVSMETKGCLLYTSDAADE